MHRIGIVGAGRMGCGIAVLFAAAGHSVILWDLKDREPAALASLRRASLSTIRQDLDFLNAAGVIDAPSVEAAMARVDFAGRAEASAAIGSLTMVFEGVPETLEAKRDAFALLSARLRADCIIASTTSTIAADQLAPLVTNPERFLNAHWLNPAHLIPLVELSPAQQTSEETLERTRELLKAIGKVPVVCRGPGYIVPRIQALAMNEAARLVEEGVASAEEIDLAIRAGFGPRFSVLGLLEFVDWGGGDILHNGSHFLAQHVSAERFAPPAIVKEHMARGTNGIRDGKGFYDYAGVDLDAYRAERLKDLIGLLQQRQLMPHLAKS